MYDLNDHPLPAFIIDEKFMILSQSKLAKEVFSPKSSFLDIVDLDSRMKASKMLTPLKKEAEVELVMSTIQSPYSLFNVFAKWTNNGQGQLVCVRQDDRIEKLSNSLQKQRERLAETNFDLLDKKEELEMALTKVKKLSSPFLPITNTIGIIPLFGTLDEQLFRVNENNLLHTLQNGDYERVILDFSGIGEVEAIGVIAMYSFCSMMKVVGVSPVLCGLTPKHALSLMEHDFEMNQKFNITGSLKDAIRFYLNSTSS